MADEPPHGTEANGPKRKPPGDDFRQQKLSSIQPIMTPLKVIICFFAIGIVFIPTGTTLIKMSDDIYEDTIVYDGKSGVCSSITSKNQGTTCQVSFRLTEDVTGPLHVYYGLDNFYQNHLKYMSSRSDKQLSGKNLPAGKDLTTNQGGSGRYCKTAWKNGTRILNPCGLIANSFFTDILSLNSQTPTNYVMDETGIIPLKWPSDRTLWPFKQVEGFQSTIVQGGNVPCNASKLPEGCKTWKDAKTNTWYNFYYPNENQYQYLYETYGTDLISPIAGVADEHFIVWMTIAALPKFRKLYGKIHGNFSKGTTLSFTIVCNYEVKSFSCSKSITISTVNEFGGKNPYLGVGFIVIGSICLFVGSLFLFKQLISPRKLGDPSILTRKRFKLVDYMP